MELTFPMRIFSSSCIKVDHSAKLNSTTFSYTIAYASNDSMLAAMGKVQSQAGHFLAEETYCQMFQIQKPLSQLSIQKSYNHPPQPKYPAWPTSEPWVRGLGASVFLSLLCLTWMNSRLVFGALCGMIRHMLEGAAAMDSHALLSE